MQDTKKPFTKRKALRIVFLVAAVLAAAILLRSFGKSGSDVSTLQGREQYLLDLGWEIDAASEDARTVQLPETLEGMLQEYNKIQLDQGFDLSRHLGEQCLQYSYRVTNYPEQDQTVLVTLYVQGKRVIAGDLHSTAINGFMHGLKTE